MSSFETLLDRVRACTACADSLPFAPRPLFQLHPSAKILIASQAPGVRAHTSGVPFSDPSGDRLRDWMGLSKERFYDPATIAVLPMGLCYPGRAPGGGDAAPRTECAPLWRSRLLDHLPELRLTLLVGAYAQAHALGPGQLTERVLKFKDFLPRYFPLPHPSWRSRIWAERNPWFGDQVLPALQEAVDEALRSSADGGTAGNSQ